MIRLRLRSLFQRKKVEEELDNELQFHLEHQMEEYTAKGMNADEARYAALRSFGGVEQRAEECRDARRIHVLENVLQDLRYGFRSMNNNIGFTVVAVLTLALGIGANTAIYSVIDGALLHPVPFSDPDRLILLYQASEREGQKNSVSYPNLLDWQRDTKTFEAIAGWREDIFTLTGHGQPEQLDGQMVSANFFSILRVQPVVGRFFNDQEDRLGQQRVVLLGEAFWKRRFAGDSSIIGQTLALNGRDYSVIGVVPAQLGSLRSNDSSWNDSWNDVFLPIGQYDDKLFYERGIGNGTLGLGRLKAEHGLQEAQAEMTQIMQSLGVAYPDANEGVGVHLVSLKQEVIGNLRPILLALGGAVGFVLLIACTNVASLMLARSTNRLQEFGLRLALGASRSRLVQQLLTESIILALFGGTLGIVIAASGTHALLNLLPEALPPLSHIGVNLRVLLFSFLVSLGTGTTFGLLHGLKAASRLDLHTTLKEGGRGVMLGRHTIQGVFVIAEVALTLVLLVGAGLTLRTLTELWRVNPGFEPQSLLTFYTGLSSAHTSSPEQIRAAFREIDDRLAALPGVDSASLDIGALPFTGGSSTLDFRSEDEIGPRKRNQLRQAIFYAVGPGHFKTMRIPLLRGRSFTRQDTATSPLVMVVDEEFGRSVFPGQDPVGKYIRIELFDRPVEIVGVVGHVKHWSLDSETDAFVRAQFYVPYLQLPDSVLTLAAGIIAGVVRSGLPTPILVEAIKRELSTFDSSRAIHHERRMTDMVLSSLARRRFSMILLWTFAAIAVVLSVIGVYGVISYFVRSRTNEIGVRIAVGAGPRDITRLVLREGGTLAGIGVLLGLTASAALTRFLSSFLFNVSPTDFLTFGSASLLLFALALVVCYVPAHRAMQIDPMVALRDE